VPILVHLFHTPEFLERVKNNRIKEATIDEAARTVTAVTTEGKKD
jgi:hypothetical protein